MSDNTSLRTCLLAALVCGAAANPAALASGPYVDGRFQGRIAYSCDGNHNDPDDWAASPVTLAILAEAGLKERLVHFDYNCILPLTDSAWERTHAESVVGAAARYGFDTARFFDCRKERDRAVASIALAIDDSTAADPLYFIIAGPMEVPYLGIQKSDPARRQYVYCISHSRWNDGYASRYQFTCTKRSVIELGVHWVQIRDQNRLLSFGRYGRPAGAEEFAPYFWMRDSGDPKVRWLWERMLVSTRPDPSDAGMTWFLATGDEECDPLKLRQLLDEHRPPAPRTARPRVRIEAENFQHLEGCAVEDRNDKRASHALHTRLVGGNSGSIRTPFDEPFVPDAGTWDLEIRYFDAQTARCRFALSVNGVVQGSAWQSPGEGRGWMSHTIRQVAIRRGDAIQLDIRADNGEAGRLDYVQLDFQDRALAASNPEQPRAAARGPLDDPAALPGQVIIAGGPPGQLKYNGGKPVFLCGPDNPEDFLFLGELNPDGTRSGPQREIIDYLGKSGANAFHIMMFRMRRCNIKDEGDDTHCPFVDFDPSKPLNEKILDQWDGWLGELEARGVIVHLEFYNDSTDVERMGWTLDGEGRLHPHERRWIQGIVKRFKHRKNILWGIEESSNKLPRARVTHFKKMAQLIAETDDHHHPIVQSFVTPDTRERDLHPDGVMSGDYRDDPHIGIVTWLHVAPHGEDYEAQHQAYLKWARTDNDRFIVMKNETEYHRIDRRTSRIHTWACVLAGVHALEAQHNAARREGRERIADDGRVVAFMEQTDWHTMRPHDHLAAGATKWVLANPGTSYIAYSYDCAGPMGLKDLAAGTYDLLWFDTVSGRMVKQPGVRVAAGGASWNKPESLGREIALYVRRQP